MKIESTIQGLRAALRQARQAGKSVAFVPTMGNLHQGHMDLVQAARRRADFVVASIFVNPTQFGVNEDFDRYPRTLEADANQLVNAGCDLLFAPSASEMYPDGRSQATTVAVAGITDILCGASRPGHFTGVATVVSKLLNIVQPDMALFGEKDYQQLAVIRRLVQELCFPVSIIGVPTTRAEDGLALSSRNGFLTPEQRQQALARGDQHSDDDNGDQADDKTIFHGRCTGCVMLQTLEKTCPHDTCTCAVVKLIP